MLNLTKEPKQKLKSGTPGKALNLTHGIIRGTPGKPAEYIISEGDLKSMMNSKRQRGQKMIL
ncbi:hypothetical protein Holit_03367 [Hollandina sp. SP2]